VVIAMRKSRLHSQKGFTMTELMTVVLILGILSAFAAPAMMKLIKTQKVRSNAYDLIADLTFTRSQAISRGFPIVIQGIGANANGWVYGWQVKDQNGNLLRQQGQCDPNSSANCPVLSNGINFTADVGAITFDRSGRSNAATINIAPTDSNATDDQKRCIKLDLSGRPRSMVGAC
jgi:type IV fimbrial biogenesis protein FimT